MTNPRVMEFPPLTITVQRPTAPSSCQSAASSVNAMRQTQEMQRQHEYALQAAQNMQRQQDQAMRAMQHLHEQQVLQSVQRVQQEHQVVRAMHQAQHEQSMAHMRMQQQHLWEELRMTEALRLRQLAERTQADALAQDERFNRMAEERRRRTREKPPESVGEGIAVEATARRDVGKVLRPPARAQPMVPAIVLKSLRGEPGTLKPLIVALRIELAMRRAHVDYGRVDGFNGWGTGTDQFVCSTFIVRVLREARFGISRERESQIHNRIDFRAETGKSNPTDEEQQEVLRRLLDADDPRVQGVVAALSSSGQGVAVGIDQLETGDLVQYWYRHKGRIQGHVALVESRTDSPGVYRLHGSHQSKKGIGVLQINLRGRGVIKVYCVRPILPDPLWIWK